MRWKGGRYQVVHTLAEEREAREKVAHPLISRTRRFVAFSSRLNSWSCFQLQHYIISKIWPIVLWRCFFTSPHADKLSLSADENKEYKSLTTRSIWHQDAGRESTRRKRKNRARRRRIVEVDIKLFRIRPECSKRNGFVFLVIYLYRTRWHTLNRRIALLRRRLCRRADRRNVNERIRYFHSGWVIN